MLYYEYRKIFCNNYRTSMRQSCSIRSVYLRDNSSSCFSWPEKKFPNEAKPREIHEKKKKNQKR